MARKMSEGDWPFSMSKRNLEIVGYREAGLTLAEIGAHFDLTRERIRQIEVKARTKAKGSREGRRLKKKIWLFLQVNGFVPMRMITGWVSELRSDLEDMAGIFADAVVGQIMEDCDRAQIYERILFLGDEGPSSFRALSQDMAELRLAGKQLTPESIYALRERSRLARALVKYCWAELRGGLADRLREIRNGATSGKLAERILKEAGEPMHWETVAERGNAIRRELGLRPLNRRSFMNAMIAGDAFAYRDQGTYGLRDWGGDVPYIKPTIIRVLKKEGKPLSFGQIELRVCRYRRVKKSSLQMYLDLRREFYKSRSGRYGLRSWLPERPTLRTDRDLVESEESAKRLKKSEGDG